MSEDGVRIDIWLWRARFFKTRSLAAKMVCKGRARIARGGAIRRISKPGARVRIGDALTFPANRKIVSLIVKGLGTRRGPASEARTLYAAPEDGENGEEAEHVRGD